MYIYYIAYIDVYISILYIVHTFLSRRSRLEFSVKIVEIGNLLKSVYHRN